MTMDSNANHQPPKNKHFIDAWRHAMAGIGSAIQTERNMRFHLLTAVLVVIAGLYLRVTPEQWLWLGLAIALVISGELVNTAIEATVDAVVHRYDHHAKKAKDCAAGMVVVLAIFAIIVGLVIFIPAFMNKFNW